MDCDFDTDSCSWTEDSTSLTAWTRVQGQTPSYGTGPETDHSGTGHYMYVEASTPNNPGRDFTLTTSVFVSWQHHVAVTVDQDRAATTLNERSLARSRCWHSTNLLSGAFQRDNRTLLARRYGHR